LIVSMIDSTHWRAPPSAPKARLLVFALGAHEDRSELGHQLLERFAGEAHVGDHRVAVELDAGEHFGRDLALGDAGRASSKAIGTPSEEHNRYSRRPQK
jgi:hypothetical protein